MATGDENDAFPVSDQASPVAMLPLTGKEVYLQADSYRELVYLYLFIFIFNNIIHIITNHRRT